MLRDWIRKNNNFREKLKAQALTAITDDNELEWAGYLIRMGGERQDEKIWETRKVWKKR